MDSFPDPFAAPKYSSLSSKPQTVWFCRIDQNENPVLVCSDVAMISVIVVRIADDDLIDA